uniref:Uncharacterized protein n=1 Tax=Noctiluca scintillans TaxID=2966 RepID=A0A7S0ZQ31_NOCSC|mmetsp:Transcript_1404/g.3762  ORF Transcript_1404/g.3762 Transcript_1404/m.3762 type:complete len:221 (+) Transcript_1404:51-713(+)|eukprot:CAMPEP_0194524672 /NCGR_PEP_ID=MMETSP0253-20130528/59927_1 /TAXON_ID=2966 /ORGANISM="Noctiluca scintillans" /LENGTH=220 /DNA_ID=CAMNT_0039369329 /DNA_START=31 /DNA_END=693 /DNA_ORIENTATION=-
MKGIGSWLGTAASEFLTEFGSEVRELTQELSTRQGTGTPKSNSDSENSGQSSPGELATPLDGPLDGVLKSKLAATTTAHDDDDVSWDDDDDGWGLAADSLGETRDAALPAEELDSAVEVVRDEHARGTDRREACEVRAQFDRNPQTAGEVCSSEDVCLRSEVERLTRLLREASVDAARSQSELETLRGLHEELGVKCAEQSVRISELERQCLSESEVQTT